jgi:hypothetical protein
MGRGVRTGRTLTPPPQQEDPWPRLWVLFLTAPTAHHLAHHEAHCRAHTTWNFRQEPRPLSRLSQDLRNALSPVHEISTAARPNATRKHLGSRRGGTARWTMSLQGLIKRLRLDPNGVRGGGPPPRTIGSSYGYARQWVAELVGKLGSPAALIGSQRGLCQG